MRTRSTARFTVVVSTHDKTRAMWEQITEAVSTEVERVESEGWTVDRESFTMESPSQFVSAYVVAFDALRY
jgi:hypothetical protein